MFDVAAITQGFAVGGVEDQRKQFFDRLSVVGLCCWFATSGANVACRVQNGARPGLHLGVTVKPSRDGHEPALPVGGSFSNQILRHPFALAVTVAEMADRASDVEGGDSLLLTAFVTRNYCQIAAAAKIDVEAFSAAKPNRLSVVGPATWLKERSASGAVNW